MQDNLSEKEIDKMIRDLKCFPESYATDHTEWDESSKISGELHNHLFDRKISDLTIYDFFHSFYKVSALILHKYNHYHIHKDNHIRGKVLG